MNLTKRLYGEVEEPLCEVAKWDNDSYTAKPRVLFILKEPSIRKENNRNYNFRGSLEDKDWKKLGMWKLLAYCSEGLQAIGRGEQSPAFEKKTAEECKKLLKYSSYMNLKRFGAARSSDMSLVGLHAGLFWQLMLEEIRKVKPEIIVCCKTYSILKELVECLSKLPEYVNRLGYAECGTIRDAGVEKVALWNWKEIGEKPMGVINVGHPARKPHEKYFNDLMNLGREIWHLVNN